MRILAISDIHGCRDSFDALLAQIQLHKKDHLFLLGDFIDRGPNSKGVIDKIWQLQADGYAIHCLKGNHEQMSLDAFYHIEKSRFWLMHGGSQTLDSFGVDYVTDLPLKYRKWMEELPHFLTFESYIFVHAGLNFEVGEPLENQHSMLWIRDWYRDINYNWLGKRYIIHGHTPKSKQEIEEHFIPFEYERTLDIDAGCAFNRRGMGHLCAVDLTNRKLFFQKRVDVTV
jgi:serine/threonine protein phosphatase 1